MTAEDGEEELDYILNCTYGGIDHYECPYCGYCGPVLEVPEGSPCPECPVCRNPPVMLPCPFCGSACVGIDWNPVDEEIVDVCSVQITCGSCGCSTGYRSWPEDAAAAWNARTVGDPAGDPPQAPEPGKLVYRTHKWHGTTYDVIYCKGCDDEFTLSDLRYGDEIACPACREVRRLTPTLKPCPCCGGTPEIAKLRDWSHCEDSPDAYNWVVYCTECGIESPRVDEPDDDLAKIWNRRRLGGSDRWTRRNAPGLWTNWTNSKAKYGTPNRRANRSLDARPDWYRQGCAGNWRGSKAHRRR